MASEESATSGDVVKYMTEEEALAAFMDGLTLDGGVAAKLVRAAAGPEDGQFVAADVTAIKLRIKALSEKSEALIREMDPDGAGSLNPEDALKLVSGLAPDFPEPSLKAMLTRFDADNSGRIDAQELLSFFYALAAKKEVLSAKFSSLDEDSSGALDHEELTSILASELMLPAAMIGGIIDDFDLNKDGKISKQEFNVMWVKLFG